MTPDDTIARHLHDDAPPPERIGHYRLQEELGHGGMGVVYLAEQTEPVRRRVALKLIKLGMDTRDVVIRFETERQALALMNHPNVAGVFDAGVTEQGRPYFVMEYVPGEPITAYCDRHMLSLPQRLDLFIQVCHAIQHAHQKGVIHRDIKPSNVLVMLQDDRPTPKVIDFGVAKATTQRLTEQTLFTQHGVLIGTPEYMSPEQAEMTTLDIDTRTDVYSLGVLLYELLTGVLPFDPKSLRSGGFAAIQRIIREVEPPKPSTKLGALAAFDDDNGALAAEKRRLDPRALTRRLRGDLDWVVMKSLEKDRTRRYGSATDLAADVQRHLNNEPVVAGPPGVGYRVKKFVRRNRAKALATAAIALMLCLSTGVSIWFWRGEANQRKIAEKQTDAANAATEKAQLREAEAVSSLNEAFKSRREALYQSYIANITAADACLQAGEAPEAKRRLAACDESMRGWEWRYLNRMADSSIKVLLPDDAAQAHESRGASGALEYAAFTADGERIVGLRQKSDRLAVWDAKTYDRIYAPPIVKRNADEESDDLVAVSPDGARAVIGHHALDESSKRHVYDLGVHDAVSGEHLAALPGKDSNSIISRFSLDGRRFAACGGFFHIARPKINASFDFRVAVWDVESGDLLFEPRSIKYIDAIAFHPNGNRIALGGYDLYILDALSGEILLMNASRENIDDIRITSLAYNPAGALIAAGTDDGTIEIRLAASLELLTTLRGHTGDVNAVAFSPDGALIASGGEDKRICLWTMGADEPLITYLGHDRTVTSVSFSPDGERLVSCARDTTARIWDASPAANTLRTHIENRLAFLSQPNLSVSSDGSLIAVGARTSMRSIDSATGQLLWTYPYEEVSRAAAMAFSKHSALLAYALRNTAKAHIWDDNTIESVSTIEGPVPDSTELIAVSPDGRYLVSGPRDNDEYDGTVRLWDLHTHTVVRELEGYDEGVQSVTYRSDGQRLALASKDAVQVWDARLAQCICEIEAPTCNSAAFSPDGKRIVLANNMRRGSLEVWNAGNGEYIHALHGHEDRVDSVAYIPDGYRIISAGRDKTIRVWDAETYELLLTLRTADSECTIVACSPDGKWLCSQHVDPDALRIWDTRSPREVWEARQARLSQLRSARELVESLHGTLGDARRMSVSLRDNPNIDDSLRKTAIQISRDYIYGSAAKSAARTDPGRAYELNAASWPVVRLPRAHMDDYRWALEKARLAVEYKPGDAAYLNTLGVAQYRVGEYEKALETLRRSDDVNSTSRNGTRPEDVAFIAMSLHQLGRREEARAAHERLKDLMRTEAHRDNQESRAFLEETRRLIDSDEAAASPSTRSMPE